MEAEVEVEQLLKTTISKQVASLSKGLAPVATQFYLLPIVLLLLNQEHQFSEKPQTKSAGQAR